MSSRIIDGLTMEQVSQATQLKDRMVSVGSPLPGLNSDLLDGFDSSDFAAGDILKFGGADFVNGETASPGNMSVGTINIPGGRFENVALIFYGASIHQATTNGTEDMSIPLLINGSPQSGADLEGRLTVGGGFTHAYWNLYSVAKVFTKTTGLASPWTVDFGTSSGEESVFSRWIMVMGN